MDLPAPSLLRKDSPIGLQRTEAVGMVPHRHTGMGKQGVRYIPTWIWPLHKRQTMAKFARTSRKTLKGHSRPSFPPVPPLPPTYAKDVLEAVVSYTGCAGVLGLLSNGIWVLQLYRTPIWFLTAVSFTERTAPTAPALAYNRGLQGIELFS